MTNDTVESANSLPTIHKGTKRNDIKKSKAKEPVEKKRTTEMTDAEVDEIVDMLGVILGKVQQTMSESKDLFEPSLAVTFLLRRMDANTAYKSSQELYHSMIGFMTVYVSFIQEVFLHKFKEFMRLFSSQDSLLNNEIDQPFLWLYLSYDKSNNLSILNDLHKQLLPKRYESNYILSRIDSIFSKFYTQYFLEAYVQKHQKDHGQFYTPQPVIDFMWDLCATVPSITQHLEENKPMLRVFDPCLGIGSFLCEFLTRFIKACRFTIWNDPLKITTLLARDIPNNIWGIEIDPFAYQLSKINMMVHLFPLYERLKEMGVALQPGMINRLRLFCNDSLKLSHETNQIVNIDTQLDPFEKACLNVLRNSSQKFDFIVTNPPYMIRKTGYVAQPDPVIYNEEKLGGRGTQAYLYFMWIALQRCDDATGQICLITPSQWTILEFAQHIREWLWENCKLLEMYEFEPFKVWPRLQTDSLIYRVCKRGATLVNKNRTLYVRSMSKKTSLIDILEQYRRFDPENPVNEIKFKITPLDDNNRKLTKKHSSLASILPSASCLEEVTNITSDLPRICDGENVKSANTNADVPLQWNRGPNTNPVYSLVVRTKWARETFGAEACEDWLRPCFYWNGKTMTSTTGGGKEGTFWRDRDPLRLEKKEMSAAEAYWPYCNLDTENPTVPFYSLILVNKEIAQKLKEEVEEKGDQSMYAALYNYLREARNALQGDKTDKEVAHCQFNRCGTDAPVKIIHPINCGYYTRSQPRQRFFVDYTCAAVTNQCIYFTIKSKHPCQNADYYCGLLNSVLLQFFAKVHCGYDQQGRMRYFGRLMAYIPFAPPPSEAFTNQVATLVQGMTEARTWIYSFVRHALNGHRLMEIVRNCEWHLSQVEVDIIHSFAPPENWSLQPDTSLSKFACPPDLAWITNIVHNQPLTDKSTIEHIFITLLKISSLFQFAIDQMVYHVYKIPLPLQLEVEEELNLQNLRKEWEVVDDLMYNENDPNGWFHHIIELAKSFTLVQNVNIVSTICKSTPLVDTEVADDARINHVTPEKTRFQKVTPEAHPEAHPEAPKSTPYSISSSVQSAYLDVHQQLSTVHVNQEPALPQYHEPFPANPSPKIGYPMVPISDIQLEKEQTVKTAACNDTSTSSH